MNASEWLGFLYVASFILLLILIFIWAMRREPARTRRRIERAMETEMITGIAHQQMQDRVAEKVRREYGL